MKTLTIIGGGLAGSEAAWQAAQRGINVKLYEMRPVLATGAHQTPNLAELVCSNSLGSNLPDRASGVLKAELRRLGSSCSKLPKKQPCPPGPPWPSTGSALPKSSLSASAPTPKSN
jgi:methylenetetrahydrofolate--tRNA-(uracil-5-)-methyltransferase